MKKTLHFLVIAILVLAQRSHGQSIATHVRNTAQVVACDLNLPNNLPSVNAQCSVEFSDLVIPVITDSCGNTVTPTTDGSIFPVTATGTTTIFWAYLNELGGTEIQTQNINILDFTRPIPDVATLPNFHSQCAVQAADLPVPTATDNCFGVVTVTNNGVFPITVSTLITWTYTDATGNTTFQNQDIYILDFTEPVADVAILPNIHGLCEVQQADVPVPTATDNCSGVVTVTNDAVFPIVRSTLITWYYTDEHGNTSYQTQDIYIDDLTKPVPDAASLADVSALCEILEADVPAPTAFDNCSGVVTATTSVVFPIRTSTVITWIYTDANGNFETQTQNAIITDAIKPVPDLASLADFTSQCAVLAIDVPVPTATDNCSIASITNDGVYPITVSTTIIWTYTDANGNSETQSQNIIINDTTAPTPDAAILANITAQCEVQQADVTAPTATDNCSGVVTVTNDGIFPITASTTITWTYTDANGNSNTQTQNVVVNDTIAPTPDNAILADVTAQCEVLEADVIAPTATDNCSGIVTVTNDGVFPITASTTITWTYNDGNGNSNTQTQNVIINDTTAPTPDAAVLTDITAQCEVLEADVIAPTATDNCSGVVTVNNDGVFPITASTTITWTYTDANGNSVTQTQNIIINDTIAPTPDAAVLSDITAQCEVLEADVIAPTATDNCSGIVTVTNDGVFPITASTTITWTYTDANGNSNTQTQNVIINDTTAPTPDNAILADVTGTCEVLEADVAIPTATDNCLGIVTVTNDGIFPITASTTITWTYTDANGNSVTQTQNIIINDTIAPTPDAAVLSDITAQCEVLEADVIAPTATDNCSGVVTVTNDGVFPINASTTITWTYTDANGNSNTQTQNIIINDSIAPTPDAATLADVTAECQVLEADIAVPTATDNCSGVLTVTNDGIFPITLSTTITWTYTDANGNSVTQTQNIIINDTNAPTPDAAVLADITAQCEVLEADVVVPTATDCSGVVTVTNDGVFPITASTIIRWTYTDVNGNSVTQTQNVIVNDTTAPTPDAATLADVTAQCEVLEADVAVPTATDNCSGIVTVTNDGIFPIAASTTITWTYTDANGNSVTQTQNIIINDTIAPTPDAAVLSDITAQCEVLEADVIAPTATDNCSGVVTVTNDGVFPINASATITWTYTDANGNSNTQTQNIIINDSIAPTPDAATLADVTAECQVLEADIAVPTATDNCLGVLTVTNDGIFPITLSTTITWTYTDANGNSVTQTQNIIINDTNAPTPDAAVLADITAQCEVLEADVVVPTATDCSGVVTVTNDGVFPITASITIRWTYTDVNGNSVTQTQNVIVNDTTAPTPDAATLADVTAQCEVLEADVAVPTATDNCSGLVTVTNDGIFPIAASTTITWTYTDANGNSTTQSQSIIINDNSAPTPDAASLADVVGTCEVLDSDVAIPTATDNCSVVTVTNDGIFPIAASTTITWTYTDANGNSSAQTQNIIISDSIAPTPDAATLADITAQCEVLQADVITPTGTDNCSIVTVTNDGIFPITASTTITWTYADANGNSVTQTQNVIINDTSAPTPDAIVLADITAQCQVLEADIPVPTATDNCSIVTVTNDGVFPIITQGATTITWTYTDANGNTATQTQDILIGDNTNPTVTLTDITVSVNVSGIVNITAAQLENGTANDNCGIASITVNPNTFTCTELGDHVVTVTVIDIHGNSTSDTATVTVTDPTDFCGALGVAHNETTAFTLYPNPTANMVYVEAGNRNEVRSIKVYSLTGQLVLDQSYNQNTERYSISLHSLAQGTYLLKFETTEGTFTKRVMKQ